MSLFAASAFGQEADLPDSSEAPQPLAELAARYAPGTITSTDLADRALEDVKRQRAVVEEEFAREEAVCYEKFFVTSCMDAAKDRRRSALKQLNAIEVEANATHRRVRVEQKDRALLERQASQEAKAAEGRDAQSSAAPGGSPATAQEVAAVESRARQASEDLEAQPKARADEGAARHEEVSRQELARKDAEAKKREENIRAYEKKRQRSLERQREVAAKKQAKAKKQQEEAAGK